MTKIKICGITRLEDALDAVEMGADALGFVFYAPSPRAISAQNAAAIIKQLPPFVSSVGLFVNPSVDDVETVLSTVPLSLLQFHGDETPLFCQQFVVPYIKAIRMKPGVDVLAVMDQHPQARGFLLDTYHPKMAGGTGQCFDWSSIPAEILRPWILAGGLTPDNVAEALSQQKPYAVDVSGGVEREKGVKCRQKIRDFCQGVIT